MTRPLKVYGMSAGRCRRLVAAKSLAEAARAMGVGPHVLRKYGCETGNEAEIELALTEPGTPFWRPLSGGPGYQWNRGTTRL